MSNKRTPAEHLPSSIRLLTVADLAAALRCSPWSVWQWCRAGLLPQPIKMGVGGRRLWRATEVEKALDRLQKRVWAPPTLRGAIARQAQKKAGRPKIIRERLHDNHGQGRRIHRERL